MNALRPGVRALRLPMPFKPSRYDGTECYVLTAPRAVQVMFEPDESRICVACDVANLDGHCISRWGGPLVWPAAYLLPLWDSDQDNEHTQPADVGEECKS